MMWQTKYPALHAIVHRYGIPQGVAVEEQNQARVELAQVFADAAKHANALCDLHIDDEAVLERQRDAAIATLARVFRVALEHGGTEVQDLIEDWKRAADPHSLGVYEEESAP